MDSAIPVIGLAARGDGVVDVDGKTRFLPGFVPGDRVRLRGEGAELVQPSPERVSPPCKHFGVCGGCQMQHVSNTLYEKWAADVVRRALAQHDLDARVMPAELSPPGSRRRTAWRAQWNGDKLQLGYREGRSHTLVPLDMCPVLAQQLLALLAPLQTCLAEFMPRKAAARIALTKVSNGIDMQLEDVPCNAPSAVQALAAFAPAAGVLRIISGGEIIYQADQPVVRIGKARIDFPAGGFLQATPEGEAALSARVVASAAGARYVADLFSGCGTFSFPLAEAVKVDAYEGSGGAVDAMRGARVRKGMKPVTGFHRDLYRRPLQPRELAKYDFVVLDPPRPGAQAQVTTLAKSTVKRITYVSCNPATFARDARILVDGGYALGVIQPIGQFLWSTHVELVATFCAA